MQYRTGGGSVINAASFLAAITGAAIPLDGGITEAFTVPEQPTDVMSR